MEKDEKIQDEKLRKLFSGTMVEPDKNLKCRIMQQVETESILMRRQLQVKDPMPILKNVLPFIGLVYVMVAAVLVLLVVMYFKIGRSALNYLSLFVPVAMVAAVCGVYVMISVLDDKRR